MKTAVTALQEMMIKLNEIPEYECKSQSGPQHLASFEYRCKARGCVVSATARSKKEAKQEAARVMLLTLKARGEDVPPPFDCSPLEPPPTAEPTTAPSSGIGPSSYVTLLRELCTEYRLPGVEYELVGDAGPPHMREFAVRAQLGSHNRLATSSTKKAARQLAAQQLYTYLRENLERLTADFVEEAMLVRAHDRIMERYVEATREEAVWRPDLGQCVADYHMSIVTHVDQVKCELAKEVVDGWYREGRREESAERAVEAAGAALGLLCSWSTLDLRGRQDTPPLVVLELSPMSPAIALMGRGRAQAAAAALRYLYLSLSYPPPPSATPAAGDAATQLPTSASTE